MSTQQIVAIKRLELAVELLGLAIRGEEWARVPELLTRVETLLVRVVEVSS